MYYNSNCCWICTDNGVTAFFTIKTGVQQGCILIMINLILRRFIDTQRFGLPWGWGGISFFTDHLALLGLLLEWIVASDQKQQDQSHVNWGKKVIREEKARAPKSTRKKTIHNLHSLTCQETKLILPQLIKYDGDRLLPNVPYSARMSKSK